MVVVAAVGGGGGGAGHLIEKQNTRTRARWRGDATDALLNGTQVKLNYIQHLNIALFRIFEVEAQKLNILHMNSTLKLYARGTMSYFS